MHDLGIVLLKNIRQNSITKLMVLCKFGCCTSSMQVQHYSSRTWHLLCNVFTWF